MPRARLIQLFNGLFAVASIVPYAFLAYWFGNIFEYMALIIGDDAAQVSRAHRERRSLLSRLDFCSCCLCVWLTVWLAGSRQSYSSVLAILLTACSTAVAPFAGQIFEWLGCVSFFCFFCLFWRA